jgi:ribosomal protein S18 acetylase RimI-like enzyme
VRQEIGYAGGATVRLRPVTADDEPFLFGLYADRRAAEVATMGLSPDQASALVEMQFRAQQQGYGARFPKADHQIVVAGGERVGRLLVDRGPQEHRVVDIALLGSRRGAGIGTALLTEVLAGAGAAGVPVRLAVAADDDRLVRWYRRLGFAVTERGAVHLSMTWEPAS